MTESPREKWGLTVGIIAIVIPGMLATGFGPWGDLLPFPAWLAMAMVGTGIAGAIATPYWDRGAMMGAIAGGGALLALWLYVMARGDFTHSATFLTIELAIPAALGGTPGLILFGIYARELPREDDTADQDQDEQAI